MRRLAVAFDADGTIVDSMKMLEDLAVRVILARNLLRDEEEARRMYRYTIGRSFADQLAAMCIEPGPLRVAANIYEEEKALLWPGSKPFPAAARLLAALRPTVLPFVASSTVPALLASWLLNNNMPAYPVIAPTKAYALQRLAADFGRENVLFVGDAPYDGAVATDAGISFIGIGSTLTEEEWPWRTTPDLAGAAPLIFQWIDSRGR